MFTNYSKLKKYLIFAILVGPAVLLRFSTSLYPIFRTIYLSFFDHNLMEQVHRYIGLNNYTSLLNDQTIIDVIGFTLAFITISVIMQLVLGMVVANLLNTKFIGRKIVRTLNLLPWVIPVIVSGYVFRWMLNADYGLITDWVFRLSGKEVQFLIDSFLARGSLILLNVWRNTPFMAIVLLAGLQSIPEELYEAAKIDGANWFQRFLNITLPASSSTIVTLGLFNIIWQIANIDIILGLTQGGPGSSTTVIAYRIYQLGMQWFNWGRASALSVYLLLIVAVISSIALYLYRKFEFTS
ncbi:carbohydrate ABC transporter permease [Halanaerobium kushneri]|uniref:Carbohydrate ABC transporter membrane protein 1, CUT1 family n=1 Tax=Halanaerobium kushneri TaxID=56779 RepID=A0A1N6WPH7_9FIRM|nr:sugar ABC transporter permease [Halanaerobium kushneri]SIQ91955.1 carbohydrate ABC transporter membrane protein 1, CUT1 family [Halanaerobium kushneri]